MKVGIRMRVMKGRRRGRRKKSKGEKHAGEDSLSRLGQGDERMKIDDANLIRYYELKHPTTSMLAKIVNQSCAIRQYSSLV